MLFGGGDMLKLFLVILIVFGVILIYDARRITKKLFSFGDQNEGSMGLKITGFLISTITSCILIFNF